MIEQLGSAGDAQDFVDYDGQVFRVPRGEVLLDNCTGMLLGARWECTRAHFERFRSILVRS